MITTHRNVTTRWVAERYVAELNRPGSSLLQMFAVGAGRVDVRSAINDREYGFGGPTSRRKNLEIRHNSANVIGSGNQI